MGACFSVSIPCDQVVNQVSQCLSVNESYISNLSENLANLQNDMEVLKAKRDDVQERVNREEFRRRRQRLAQVQVWLNSVLALENQFSDLLRTSNVELQRLCFCGFCSKNVKMSYRYGKRVARMLKKVESVTSLGEKIDEVTEEVDHVTEVEEMPIQPIIVGQETLLKRVWDRLTEDGVGIMGLYGMGGVGKTTLIKQINNKFSNTKGSFDVVIWVVVSKTLDIHKIQGDIAKKLGFRGQEWDEDQRALEIYNVLKRQKFVLFLDDIWAKVNLSAIGVPYPNEKNGCKVVFTTRSRDVCGRMEVDDSMEVSCLDPDKAWELFQKKVGENTLKIHEDIRNLARQVVEKCSGLPLALNVIGETMSCRTTVEEWRRAIDVLTLSAADFAGMEDEILPILKYSYDSLRGEVVKSCFLYCSLFPEDDLIEKEKLVDYWICEGLIDENEGRERAVNQVYEILGTLVRACLLLENGSFVSMHDVVREMALWISSDLGKHKERWIVQAGVGLRKVPKVKDWRDVRKMSLMRNNIKKISGSPACAQLTTLFLHGNLSLVHISDEFFRYIPTLVVLDLSCSSLSELPKQISKLISLSYLDLSSTGVKQLQVGLQEFRKLIYLNLEDTRKLAHISGISNLSSLKTLRLRGSGKKLDMSLLKELQLVENLQVLTIDISSGMVWELVLSSSHMLVKCIQSVLFEGFEELTLPATCHLRSLVIRSYGMGEIKIERTISSLSNNPTTPCFPNLSRIYIDRCNHLKDLTWLVFAPNLVDLTVRSSDQLEEIINEEKAASAIGGCLIVRSSDQLDAGNIVPFQKLRCLELYHLPMFKSIYRSALSFPRLNKIFILKCPKLRKLPLDSNSVVCDQGLSVIYTEEEWIKEVEWEDEATQLRFLPFFKQYG